PNRSTTAAVTAPWPASARSPGPPTTHQAPAAAPGRSAAGPTPPTPLPPVPSWPPPPNWPTASAPTCSATSTQSPSRKPPPPRPPPPQPDEPDTECQPPPDGRYCLPTGHTPACTALAYAFWRIQAHPLATTPPAALDRATRRRAQRASIAHTTRIVMLRRTTTGPAEGQPRSHYQVRFVVRGSPRQSCPQHKA